MRCPNCDFENPEEEERCFRCRACLRQLDPAELTPPRGHGGGPGIMERIRIALRRYSFRNRVPDTELNFRVRRFQFLFPVILSLLLPGLGQVCNRKYFKALLFFVAFVVIFFWAYLDAFGEAWLGESRLHIFLHLLGGYALLLNVVHTWIVFDAYQDSIRRYEQRRVTVLESAVFSAVIACVFWSLLFTLLGTASPNISLQHLVHAPNLKSFDLFAGDILVLDRAWYNSHGVKRSEVVPFTGGAIYAERGYMARGMNPSVIIGLPGDRIYISASGIYREGKKVADSPPQWVAPGPGGSTELQVPGGRYFLLPGWTGQNAGRVKECLVGREMLGGKFLMVRDPRHRRRALP